MADWYRVKGGTPVVGKGKLYTYDVNVEVGINIDRKVFAQTVDAILADSRGWTRGGKVAFQRVGSRGNTHVMLATPDTVDVLCYPLKTEGEVSCCQGSLVVVNLERWREGVPHWKPGTVRTYRQMLINHEFGHRIGKNHATCSGAGKKAPVMQQQTYGLQGCTRNPWPLAREL
jgi:Protein of unknown function (DUF3152)